MEGSAFSHFFVIIESAGSGTKVYRWQHSIKVVICSKNVCPSRKTVFVERLKITKNFADFILFVGISVRLSCSITILSRAVGKDHIIDEFSNPLAVGIVEYLAKDAFEEGLILKLDLLLSGQSRPLASLEWRCI
jgi:hypothetical protein